MLVLIGHLALVFGLSVAIELRAWRGGLGNKVRDWLTLGYRAFEYLLAGWCWVLVVAMAFGSCVLVLSQLPVPLAWVRCADAWVSEQSQSLLPSIAFVFTAGATGLVAIGSLAFKKLQELRVPLDAALDVHNHLREFPRKATRAWQSSSATRRCCARSCAPATGGS